MEYVVTAFRLTREEETYKSYVADGLYVISNTLADAFGGKRMVKRYSEIIYPQEENITGAEVIQKVKDKLKGLSK